MFSGRNLVRTSTRLGLLACSVTGLLTLAACSSSSSTATGPGTSSLASPSSAARGSAGATSSARPSWAAALGAGVTVVAPHWASAGHGSPGAVIAGLVAALNSRQFARSCAYAEPGAQAQCRASQIPSSQMPFVRNFALGYVVIDGNRAAVGMTGKFCTPGHSPECFTNHDPAAVFSGAKSFSALWSNAVTPSSDYSLNPCIEVGGKWYIYSSSSPQSL